MLPQAASKNPDPRRVRRTLATGHWGLLLAQARAKKIGDGATYFLTLASPTGNSNQLQRHRMRNGHLVAKRRWVVHYAIALLAIASEGYACIPCSLISNPACSSSGETRSMPIALSTANTTDMVTNAQPQIDAVPTS